MPCEGNITRSSVTCRVSLSHIYRVLRNSFSYPRYARITTHSNNARTFSCKCSDTRSNLNGAAVYKNYSSNGYFQKKTGTVSNTIKGRCSLGYKREHSAVCRYFTHNAIPHAHGAPKLRRTAFNDKRGTNEGCFNSLKQREQRRERLLRPVCRAFGSLRDKEHIRFYFD